MKVPCSVIQDLLPLYADEACSEESGRMVREHLQECAECGRMLERLKSHEKQKENSKNSRCPDAGSGPYAGRCQHGCR